MHSKMVFFFASTSLSSRSFHTSSSSSIFLDWWTNFNLAPSRKSVHLVVVSNFEKMSLLFVCHPFLWFSALVYLMWFIENAARNYGLPDSELFQTVDLFEKRNIPQVTQCIHALGRYVSLKRKRWRCWKMLSNDLGPEEKFQRSNIGSKNVRC